MQEDGRSCMECGARPDAVAAAHRSIACEAVRLSPYRIRMQISAHTDALWSFTSLGDAVSEAETRQIEALAFALLCTIAGGTIDETGSDGDGAVEPESQPIQVLSRGQGCGPADA